MKVLLATSKPFASQAVNGIQNVIESAGYTFEKLENYSEKSQLLDALIDVDALIVRSDIIDAEIINKAPNLKIIVRAGAGYDNVNILAAEE